VLFLSGDVHFAELSLLRLPGLYPLYDLTSSGLNQDWPVAPSNSRRLSGPVQRHNWGRVAVDWARRQIELEIRDAQGALELNRTVLLDELRFPA
jgi:alkaline phosphatase D